MRNWQARLAVSALLIIASASPGGAITTASRGNLSARVSAQAIAPSAGNAKFTTLYRFKSIPDGSEPIGALVNLRGALYGTTYTAGSRTRCFLGNRPAGCGVVFAINPISGHENVSLRFNGVDGAFPQNAALLDLGGTLYGTTAGTTAVFGTGCRKGGCGTVYALDPTTGIEHTLYRFKGAADGQFPIAGLINVGGTLYGTTDGGGGGTNCSPPLGCGTVFSIDPATGRETIVHRFTGGADGAAPRAALLNVGGALYGTTYEGGGSTHCGGGCGTIFSIDPAAGTERIVHRFGFSDGEDPQAELINVGGMLYGTTFSGTGNLGNGTVFAIDPATGTETIIHRFTGGADGAIPEAALVDVDGTLYGTTLGGGTGCTCGTVYAINLATRAESVVYSFTGGASGASPFGGALIHAGGALYGTTPFGGNTGTSCGTMGCGTVFKLQL